jgi:type I restriction enzyme S subunit
VTAHWESVELGEICDVRRGSMITEKRTRPGEVPVVAGGIGPAYFHDTPNREANVITVSGSGANAGFVNFYDRPIWASDCSTVEPKDEAVDIHYVHRFLLSAQRFINENLRQGAAQPHVYPKDIARLEVPLPPLEEQRRIVEILDQAFAALDRADKFAATNLADADALFEVWLAAAFDYGRDKWPEKRLPEISENLDRRRIPITKGDRESGPIPYYGASGVVDHVADHIFDEDLLLISEDGANLLARTYPIAFSISGKSWVNNHAHVLRFENRTDQEFVRLYFESISLEPYVSGMAQPKLNQKALNSIPIPYPTGKYRTELVENAANFRSSADAAHSCYEAQVSDLEDVRRALLQKAFAGELT